MGKNYLIIGASSGIGEACVHKLSKEAGKLVLVARSEDKLKTLKSQYADQIEIFPVPYDLADLEHIRTIYDVCKEQKIKLDGMVYSAGMDGTWPVKVNNTTAMQQMMTVNCFAFVEMAKIFYSKRYSNEGASIVAISSIASLTSEIGMSSYCASKAALNSYVKTMSKEFVRRRIRVNAVLPAGVGTPMAEEKGKLLAGVTNNSGQDSSDIHDPQPLGLIPSEIIASQVEFLLSERAEYMTGELLTIGAGRPY